MHATPLQVGRYNEQDAECEPDRVRPPARPDPDGPLPSIVRRRDGHSQGVVRSVQGPLDETRAASPRERQENLRLAGEQDGAVEAEAVVV